MKKFFSFTAAFILAVCMLVPFTSCENNESGSAIPSASEIPVTPESAFTFNTETYNGKEYVFITGLTDEGKLLTEINVPEKYGEKTIVGLAAGCFSECAGLRAVVVHSNITDWGASLFNGCKKLEKIYMDYSGFVTAIKDDPELAGEMTAATAYDGTLYGDNSIVAGAPSKARFVFDSDDVMGYFATDYTWGVYSELYTVNK